ncbi:hypothetical protein [Rhodohalobacter barkolensis]|uniref:Prenyltransferase n=1 Tax=Rhodohalobacter barkolensis TaxID=2053187 RepID=A0A2N0VK78_9BACT|nr:hypothetical protein [Rhodohalobacter barkolensis]PKD44574.1 hypothetical protein CWD77_03670 [Rhodohalobacter barkolensis]
MKTIFDLYIKSSIHVAVSIASFTALTYLHLGLRIDPGMIFFTFFCTISGYNYIKYSDVILHKSHRLTSKLKIILFITSISVVGIAIFLPSFDWGEILFLSALAMLSFYYSHPVINRFKNLRSITGIKILIIAIVWTGFTVVLPGLKENIGSEKILWIEALQRFLIVIILTLPFDLRDLRTDSGQIKTIPQLIGINNSKYLSTVLIVIVIGVEIIFPYKIFTASAVFIVISLILLVITLNTPLFQSRYYASFWIEGIPIVWFIALFLLT